MQILVLLPPFLPSSRKDSKAQIQSSLSHVSEEPILLPLALSFPIYVSFITNACIYVFMGVTRIIRPSPQVMDMEIYNLIASLNKKSFSGYVKTRVHIQRGREREREGRGLRMRKRSFRNGKPLHSAGNAFTVRTRWRQF